ncbi:MAG: hypothetical protein ACRC1K_25720 [Planctomycetia bacterium]
MEDAANRPSGTTPRLAAAAVIALALGLAAWWALPSSSIETQLDADRPDAPRTPAKPTANIPMH